MTKTDFNYIHCHLLKIVNKKEEDFSPFGSKYKNEFGDCSQGCSHFLKLNGEIGNDWGVCTNEKSHRCGLLTNEHQGCEFHATNEIIGKSGQ